MIFPIQYKYHPDTDEGRRLKGQGKRIMIILESMMNSDKSENQTIKFCPYDGSLIVAHKFFGQRVVDIYTQIKPQPMSEDEKPICLCNCNFSIGWVLELQAETINGAPLYTVMACNNKGTAFVPYKDVLASDWTPYVVGDQIAMVPYYAMSFICCVDKTGAGGPRGCKPTVSTVTTDQDEWRTAYRIVPLCTSSMPMKVEKGRWNPNG